MDISKYIAGGYIVTQFVEGASYNSWMRSVLHATEDLLPVQFLSVAICGASRAPIFEWATYPEEDYARFGISDRLPELGQWANERYEKEIGYPDIFFYLATAREYVERFTSVPDIEIVGIGVHEQDLHYVAEAELLRPESVNENGSVNSGFSRTGFAEAVRLADPCEPGEVLGFEVICCYYNIDHSWHCNGLAVYARREFGFRPNQFGMIDDKTDADKVVRWINNGEPKPEMGVWLPVLVSRYPAVP